MNYAVIGVLATAVLLIINHDIIFRRHSGEDGPAYRFYRLFLQSVLAYLASDILWGLFRQFGLTHLQYADTVVMFTTMALAIVCWTKYVVVYLEQTDLYGKFLVYAGNAFFAFQLIALAVNFFYPVFFRFDAAGVYQPGVARTMSMIFQIAMFLLTAVYTFNKMSGTESIAKRNRYKTIGSFGIAMTTILVLEIVFPIMPLYSAGYMVGICLLHTFVIEDELGDYILELENSLQREKAQTLEIISAQRLAHTDPLTGIKNKLAYLEKERELDARIESGEIDGMAIAIFDLNNLKEINDTMGHDVGDQAIEEGCRMICRHFQHSPVFRIGGDEFAAILEGNDFNAREELMETFNRMIDDQKRNDGVVVAAGISDYCCGQDASIKDVFDRADQHMYARKKELKYLAFEA